MTLKFVMGGEASSFKADRKRQTHGERLMQIFFVPGCGFHHLCPCSVGQTLFCPPITARKALCPRGKENTVHNDGGPFTVFLLALRLPLSSVQHWVGELSISLCLFFKPLGSAFCLWAPWGENYVKKVTST